jgi:DNA invertase Pin-like site-specific DNA recombinase
MERAVIRCCDCAQIDLTSVRSKRVLGFRDMAKGKFISYLRVSTDKQGRSGLGIEAQREAVSSYLNGGRWTLVSEYVETESGRKSDRPKLAAALSHAKAIGAKLVFAKLDRLTRNVDLLRSLVASDVDLVFCDLPSVPPGPMGKFLLTQMAAVAELEAGLIGERTKKALAAAKARGVRLGNPNGARALSGKQTGNAEAVAKIKEKATRRAIDLQGIIETIKLSGTSSVRAITDELNRQGISSPRGSVWHPTAVARLLNRLPRSV